MNINEITSTLEELTVRVSSAEKKIAALQAVQIASQFAEQSVAGHTATQNDENNKLI